MKNTILSFLCFLAVFVQSCKEKQLEGNFVHTVDEFHEAVTTVKPGDVITLANGVWENAELLFEGNGTAEKPITLTVQEKGKVILEGASNLRIAGNHLVVEGLVFKNGFTPTTEVISFKKDKTTLANNSRLTECVIDNYNNPERHEPDTWVAIYGKNNRVDHNHLVGKNNRGVTMIVRLNSKESQKNHNRIDHNYFGPRPNLGSNGGETLRIGTSHYSRTNSNTIVEANFFDRCNGEHEIISNKSGQNTYKNNVFYECTGTLTMRHGNETLVDGNVFIGNNKPSTGGIRVINGQQTVTNNYGIGLTGYRFRGAFVIMNGIYNSPINRYDQAKDAVIKNNTFINSDHIQLGAGADAERNAPPENCVMANNIFYNERKNDVFTVYSDISGIAFKDNIISPNINPITDMGFEKRVLELTKNKIGFIVPKDENLGVGAKISPDIATKANTGVFWYSKEDTEIPLSSGKTIQVAAGLNTLFEAVSTAEPGDVLELTSEGPYTQTKTIAVAHPLTVKGVSGKKPVVLFEKKSLFEIQNGGSLSLEGLIFNGSESPDRTGNSVITTSKYSMNKNYKLFIENCEFVDLDVNHSYDAIRVYKNTFADTISIKNSRFKTISGNVIALDKETDDIGIYNAEYVIMKNNSFTDIGGVALRLYRGGKDESTFGPFLEMEHNVFDDVGHDKRNKYDATVSLYGVQEIDIKNNIFKDSKAINMHLVVGEPIVKVRNNALSNSEKLKVTGDQKYTVENQWNLTPEFSDDSSYSLSADSPLKGKATDGSDLGILPN
ncbi:MAG: chondroitinase-B domain-containing protein [Saonia sp.]